MSSKKKNNAGGLLPEDSKRYYTLPYQNKIRDLNAKIRLMQNEIDRLKQILKESSNRRLPETPVANSDSIKSNQMTKKGTRSQSVSTKRMSAVNTGVNVYHKCLGCHDHTEKNIPKVKKKQKLDVLSFTPVASKSSGLVGLSSVKVPVYQEIESRSQVHVKQPNPDSFLESNQATSHKTTRKRSNSAAKEKGVPPFSPMAFPSMVNLSSAEGQQDIKIKRRGAPRKQPNPDLIQPNQSKPQITKRARSNSVGAEKISEVNVKSKSKGHSFETNQISKQMTRKTRSQSVCMETMDGNIPKKNYCGDPKNLEIPKFSLKQFVQLYSESGTENMSDATFIKRHLKIEKLEIQRKRWDIQRIRELNRIEHLKRGRKRNKRQSVNSDEDTSTTSLQNSAKIVIKVIES